MGVPTSGSSGSLQAEVVDVKMDINDDDEDVPEYCGGMRAAR